MNTNKAPDKIYVREFAEGVNQMWSHIKATETSAIAQHVYIRKDVLLKWAEEEMMKAAKQSDAYGRRNAFMDVIDKINSM